MAHLFVGLGEKGRKIFLFEANRTKKFRQVLWGDWLTIDGADLAAATEADDFVRVIWAPNDPERRKTLFIPRADTQSTRPLEIIFVDVGQGDGAVLVTPETGQKEGVIVIDAGEGDNMQRFLNGRFRAYRGFNFEAAIITHPDSDHYNGFKALFADQKIGFRNIWHNGLVERPVTGTWEKIGAASEAGGITYQTEIVQNNAGIEALFSDATRNGNFLFPNVMHAAITNPKIGEIKMLSTVHGTQEGGRSYMPGFAPQDGRGYAIEVLGPVVEPDAAGRPRLRRIKSYGETKNGHSVLLRLQYGKFSVFFGGDLNEPAEKFLLTHYGGLTKFPAVNTQAYREMVYSASLRFRSDIMKVCHHGSEKVTDAFMEAVNPACFIISSGDEEGHVHPRPDLLGRLGRLGRGKSPVLLSTELQRSTREKEDQKLSAAIMKAVDALSGTVTEAKRVTLRKTVEDGIRTLSRRNVTVYGAIYLKTDGNRLITAFKIETQSPTEIWFYFEYVFQPSGELLLID